MDMYASVQRVVQQQRKGRRRRWTVDGMKSGLNWNNCCAGWSVEWVMWFHFILFCNCGTTATAPSIDDDDGHLKPPPSFLSGGYCPPACTCLFIQSLMATYTRLYVCSLMLPLNMRVRGKTDKEFFSCSVFSPALDGWTACYCCWYGRGASI